MTRSIEALSEATDREATSQPAERRRGPRRRADRHEPNTAAVVGAAALATLDKLNRGVVLLDATGAICFANQSARAMVAKMNGVLVRRGRLQFEAVDAHTTFESFLNSRTGAADGGSLVLRVGGGRRRDPYRVLVSSLGPRPGRHADGAGCCVFIYEPNGGKKPLPGSLLGSLYGLTAAEGRLANALFVGQSLADAAVACGTRVNTAKSVLKRIFTKCDVHSQGELLLLLSLGPRTP